MAAKDQTGVHNPHYKHGLSGIPEHRAYVGAHSRCSNPNMRQWKNYGGRGIKFLFTSFEQFLSHIGLKPSPELSLDRIDNDGNYEVGNVRWATKAQQMASRNNHKIDPEEKRRRKNEFMKEYAQTHKEQRDAYMKEYVKSHKEEIAAYLKAYKQKRKNNGESQ